MKKNEPQNVQQNVQKIFPEFENRDFYLELGEHIAFYRKRARLTQQELSDRIDVTRCYLSRIESPNTVQSFSLEVLFNISRILNVPVVYFFQPLPDPNEE